MGEDATPEQPSLAAAMAELSAAYRSSEDERERRMREHPDNGRAGWWRVFGIRHHAIVRADSAPAAIAKAHEAKLVDMTWESPEASWWCEELPDALGFSGV